jgi:hypothetical protein
VNRAEDWNIRAHEKLAKELAEEERLALDALARYKFLMFGYHAAWWVKLNRLIGGRRPNPFRSLVAAARVVKTTMESQKP